MDQNTIIGVEEECPKTEKGCVPGGPVAEKDAGNESNGKWATILVKKISDPERNFSPVFATLCVFAVSLDPIFFYIPFIDEDNKCLGMNKTLMKNALILRSIMDIIFVVPYICRLHATTINGNISWKQIKSLLLDLPSKGSDSAIFAIILFLITDVCALLPLPQLLVFTFNHMGDSIYMKQSRPLIVVLFWQYIQRIYRLFPLYRRGRMNVGMWLEANFNFFLYMLASHVLGALWYFFSIQRELSCWHLACVKHSSDPIGCVNNFYCGRKTTASRNITFLNEHCPLEASDNASLPFNFGIFLDSLKNNNAEHLNFVNKFFYSFWWGLRNLSNFGTNLSTSMFVWENFFAIIVSLTGFILLLYLIGSAQNMMVVKSTHLEDIRLKIMRKKREMRKWTTRNEEIPEDMKIEIMRSISQIKWSTGDAHPVFYKDLESDSQDRFALAPVKTRQSLHRFLCLEPLKRLPMLSNMEKKVLEMMCDNLKAVRYEKNSFIFRKGDPLDCMLLITEGTIWTYSDGATSSEMVIKRLGKGDTYGEELLSFASPTFITLPKSTQHAKTRTEVEAFALMADNLETVVSEYQEEWKCLNSSIRNNTPQGALEETTDVCF